MELQELRNEINRIDGEMLALLERRLAVCRAIAEYKRQNGLPVRDPARETEKLHEAMERGGAAGQRLVALLIDWLLCKLIAGGLGNAFGWSDFTENTAALVVFGLQAWLLVGFAGTTVGKAIAGLHVVRLDGGPVGPVWALARALLLLLVVPALFWDRDHRGLHDRAAGSIVVESREGQ